MMKDGRSARPISSRTLFPPRVRETVRATHHGLPDLSTDRSEWSIPRYLGAPAGADRPGIGRNVIARIARSAVSKTSPLFLARGVGGHQDRRLCDGTAPYRRADHGRLAHSQLSSAPSGTDTGLGAWSR